MDARTAITPLIGRVIVFAAILVVISGVIGPRIISGGILFRDGFALYGGIGKTVLFGLIACILLVRHNKTHVVLRQWRPALLGWLLAACLTLACAWIAVDNLLAGQHNFYNLLGAHAGLWVSVAFAALGCFGPKNIQLLWRSYARDIISSAALALLFYVFLLGVYALWQPLASVVLASVAVLLDASGLPATMVPPHTLIFDKFGITIAEYCSGIESIALFSGLYAIVGLLDWQRLQKRRYFVVFPFALFLLFVLNIVRVYGLIMAGYYINPQIAFSLFHTYAGMVFFILYSALFWGIAYKYLLNKEGPPPRAKPL